jgi:hypothetical protein
MSGVDDERYVAGDVAPAIVGPMRRRKDGRWDWRDANRRSLEAAYGSWVIRVLETDGHTITDLWSPDYDRDRQPELLTRPELAMRIDGEQAALDVTMFTTNVVSRAAGRGTAIRREIESRLTSLDDERSILGSVVYDRDKLIALTRRQRLEQTDSIADAYVAAARSTTGAVGNQRLEIPLSWVRGAAITLTTDRPGRRRINVYVMPPRPDVALQVDSFILECIARKGSQMAPWGRGILVIGHGFYEAAVDVQAGFARLRQCPWWRVYWAGPSPDDVHLVAKGEAG